MKTTFPGPGEQLVCEVCGHPLIDEIEASESDLCEYRWCERCMDFVHGLVVRVVGERNHVGDVTEMVKRLAEITWRKIRNC